MAGLVVFNSLREALNAGYTVIDRVPEGYLLHIMTLNGWAMALARVGAV